MKEFIIMSNNSQILTPYGAAKLVNVALEAAGLKRIPPQMMYNYTTARVAAGKAPFIEWNAEDGVDLDSLNAWTAAYLTKKQAKVIATVADPEQAEFDHAEAN